jgi:hypothetical protein
MTDSTAEWGDFIICTNLTAQQGEWSMSHDPSDKNRESREPQWQYNADLSFPRTGEYMSREVQVTLYIQNSQGAYKVCYLVSPLIGITAPPKRIWITILWISLNWNMLGDGVIVNLGTPTRPTRFDYIEPQNTCWNSIPSDSNRHGNRMKPCSCRWEFPSAIEPVTNNTFEFSLMCWELIGCLRWV